MSHDPATPSRPAREAIGLDRARECRRIACGLYLDGDAEARVMLLQSMLPPSNAWRTRPHVTLSSLPPPGETGDLARVMARAAMAIPPLDLRLTVVRRAARSDRTVLFAVAEPGEALRAAAAVIRRLSDPRGEPISARFVPHVTLHDAAPDNRDGDVEARTRSAWSPQECRVDTLSLAGEIAGYWYPLADSPLSG